MGQSGRVVAAESAHVFSVDHFPVSHVESATISALLKLLTSVGQLFESEIESATERNTAFKDASPRVIVFYDFSALSSKPSTLVDLGFFIVTVALLGAFEPRFKLKNCCLERWQILRNGCFHDRSGCVEIMVRKPVAHSSRVRPPGVGLARDELGIQQLDGLANFDQTKPNGVENEAVREVATSEVAPDCGNRVDNVCEAFFVVA